jgi:hypothetical protein
MSAKAALESLTPTAEARLAELRSLSHAVLSALPAVEEHLLTDTPKRAILSVYRDDLPSGELRVVVQLVVMGVLGSARIWAQGFRLRHGGEPVRTTDEELYDFF